MKRINYWLDSSNIGFLYWVTKTNNWKKYRWAIYYWLFLSNRAPMNLMLSTYFDYEANHPKHTTHKGWFMPIITPSERDILRSKIVTPGWYEVKIDEIGEKPSADGNSTNYPVTGTIIRHESGDTEFAGVPLDWNFNSKAIRFTFGFLESLGVEVKANQRIELKAAEGHVLGVFVENDTYQGRVLNRVNHKYRAAQK